MARHWFRNLGLVFVFVLVSACTVWDIYPTAKTRKTPPPKPDTVTYTAIIATAPDCINTVCVTISRDGSKPFLIGMFQVRNGAIIHGKMTGHAGSNAMRVQYADCIVIGDKCVLSFAKKYYAFEVAKNAGITDVASGVCYWIEPMTESICDKPGAPYIIETQTKMLVK
jgi:hypothetical protein